EDPAALGGRGDLLLEEGEARPLARGAHAPRARQEELLQEAEARRRGEDDEVERGDERDDERVVDLDVGREDEEREPERRRDGGEAVLHVAVVLGGALDDDDDLARRARLRLLDPLVEPREPLLLGEPLHERTRMRRTSSSTPCSVRGIFFARRSVTPASAFTTAGSSAR